MLNKLPFQSRLIEFQINIDSILNSNDSKSYIKIILSGLTKATKVDNDFPLSKLNIDEAHIQLYRLKNGLTFSLHTFCRSKA